MIGIDTGIPLGQPNNSLSSISPYDLPVVIWSLIQENFAQFNVEVSESYPTKEVTGNKIAWRIVRRSVGTGPTGRKQATKAQLTNWLETTPDGTLYAEYTQEHLVDFEFAVFSYSSAEADKIAWLLEKMILLCEGALKRNDPGFTLCFAQQTVDLNLQERHEDDVIARYIRFTATVPVREQRSEVELRFISKYIVAGDEPQCVVFQRASTNTKFYIPVINDQVITQINGVFILTGGVRLLKPGIDYCVKMDSNSIRYIDWNDGKGATPNVGDSFKVLYTIGKSTCLAVPRTITPRADPALLGWSAP